MKLIIPGMPIAKARPKFCRKGLHLQPYDPQQVLKETTKLIISSFIHEKIHSGDKQFIIELSRINELSAIIVHLDFFFPVLSTKKINPWLFEDHIFKPDLDNLEKYYLDLLSKTVIPDDKQIVQLSSTKRFSQKPRTEITIMPKKKMEVHDKVKQVLNIFDPNSVEEFYEDVETLQMLLQGVNLKNMEMVKPEWMASTACFLSHFSHRYCDRLIKVKKLGDISKEVDEYETRKKELDEPSIS